ncbi:MAG: hypothetical protein ACR2N6_00655 [Miltoncostaeaceae bacterium]
MSTEETPAIAWVRGLSQAARTFSATRSAPNLAVRIQLGDGNTVLAHRVAAGPGPTMLTIDVYPDDPDDDMVDGFDDSGENPTRRTPSAALVDLRTVGRVEFLIEPPGDHQLGFAPPEDH